MLEEHAVVVALVENGQVLVATQRQSGCGSCQSKTSCGAKALNNTTLQQTMNADANGHSLAINDVVVLGMAESIIWQGMLQLYVWPLIALSVGGVLGQYLAGELGAVIGAIVGLSVSLWAVAWRTQREQNNYLPIVIKKLV